MDENFIKDLRSFLEKISELQIKEINVPENLKIPNWPKSVGTATIYLGKRNYLYPVYTEQSGMLCFITKRQKIIFDIFADGTWRFRINGFGSPDFYMCTYTDKNLTRVRALFLLHQFKEEIFSKLLEILKDCAPEHNNIVSMVEKALEPFIPSIVAEQLSC